MPQYELLELPWIEQEWQKHRAIRALSIEGDSEALDALTEWAGSSQSEFKHVLATMRILGEGQWNPSRSSSCSYKGLFEIRRGSGGHARLFFFAAINQEESDLVTFILSGSYWKTRKSHALEDEAMSRAYSRMNEFLKANPEWKLVPDASRT